uniref:Cytochrome P450 n=1 Tax=Araucaria cunninghamii TaxID=56994 RepID=A0A0D6QU15_ARACU
MELGISSGVEILVAIGVIFLGGIVLMLFRDLIWRPFAVYNVYTKQGLRGPSYHFLTGSVPEYQELMTKACAEPMKEISHDIVPRIMPHYHKWCQIYGEPFFYWYGVQSRLYIAEPELIKEVLFNKFGFYYKNPPKPLVLALLGRGLGVTNGSQWAKHRRIVSPAFNIDKLKTMVKRMASCTLSILEKWQEMVTQADSYGKEIDVHSEFRALTADIISHTAFGTSYNEGKEVFEFQRELQTMAAEAERSLFIPGSQYIPTSKNRYAWRIDRRVKEILKGIIQSRLKPIPEGTDVDYGNDLLGIMMTANKREMSGIRRNLGMTIDEIMDECKTFFFAGHDTTSNLLTWTVFLLSINPEWQEKLRDEVTNVCGTDIPDADMLGRLKLMSMVLYEALRLYPPGSILTRITYKEMKLGSFALPKETRVVMAILAMHHSKKFWGEDARMFRPERFSGSAAKASIHPNVFIPFSTGPRSCVGQHFAMLEAKTVLSMILQRFSFSLSPAYRHAPIAMLTLQPQYGMQIIFKSVEM